MTPDKSPWIEENILTANPLLKQRIVEMFAEFPEVTSITFGMYTIRRDIMGNDPDYYVDMNIDGHLTLEEAFDCVEHEEKQLSQEN